MNIRLKPLDQQVMVITGASSGIGLATALAAAAHGVQLVLAARSTGTLATVVSWIEQVGGAAIAVTADVGERAQVEHVAAQAIARFGRIDSWVNNAGIGIFGRIDEVPDAESRRLFDVNFWGVVHGSLVALPHLRAGSGGALINLGSELSEGAAPLQAMYSASKFAVKGFTDALRMELDADGAPVAVTLIQPAAVDTPFPEHAANHLSSEPKLPSPLIEAGKVAAAILDAASEPVRDVKVGAVALLDTWMAKLLPSLRDTVGELQMGRQQRDEPSHAREGRLFRPSESGRVRGRGNQNTADAADALRSNLRPQDGG